MTSLRALHVASFNGNIGDNANHNGFRRKLMNSLECDIEFEEVEMREFYQSWNIRDFNSDEFINLCNSFDLVIIGGGNFFELKWDYSYTGTTINISNESLDKINTPILFHALGCDIAKGASQSTISKFDKFLEKVTNSEKYFVSLRNDGSYNTVTKLYGDKYNEKVYRAPDGAFFLESKKFNFPELNSNLKSVGINIVSDMTDIRFNTQTTEDINYEEFLDGFANVVNDFLENHSHYQIILFPHIFSDLNAIYKLMERINDKFRRTRIVTAPCLTGKGSEEYIFGLYKECEFILGMRFHSNVCSIAQGIPTIGLSSYKKIHDLYSELDILDRLVYVNKKGFENKLYTEIEYLINNLELVKDRYKKVNEVIETEGNQFYNKIKKWFHGVTSNES
ncbi:hypothetical protein CR203_06040 [Salipaludibacillus neizhouensis]|uniref:Polysaccharide pyruvyl transferase domain-containing protein n=1 Tax=Salipaludibacillus neizhouensis TaxID=885475 RepID=A0A3A9KTW7_9BACI|nr:polysaccharide pyruvyl transferase family protein [Salipaludibacillus neizhouensis]RKL68056.1 hypothetical protein CR203_06040 [Salipaludibacillus neizhouensis]